MAVIFIPQWLPGTLEKSPMDDHPSSHLHIPPAEHCPCPVQRGNKGYSLQPLLIILLIEVCIYVYIYIYATVLLPKKIVDLKQYWLMCSIFVSFVFCFWQMWNDTSPWLLLHHMISFIMYAFSITQPRDFLWEVHFFHFSEGDKQKILLSQLAYLLQTKHQQQLVLIKGFNSHSILMCDSILF